MSEVDFYDKGKQYWETIPATLDGMLGGFSSISNTDIQSSSKFLTLFLNDKKTPVGNERALDCGCGIGRITKHLLLKFFKFVDMVEQNKSFLDASVEYVNSDQVENRFHEGLQDFIPEPCTYDVIWCQWVIGHLTDKDFVTFLTRCKSGLRQNGIIVIKDNLASGRDEDVDHEDGSVTRPRKKFLDMFRQAGLEVVAERRQHKFPKGLYQVKMFALR